MRNLPMDLNALYRLKREDFPAVTNYPCRGGTPDSGCLALHHLVVQPGFDTRIP